MTIYDFHCFGMNLSLHALNYLFDAFVGRTMQLCDFLGSLLLKDVQLGAYLFE